MRLTVESFFIGQPGMGFTARDVLRGLPIGEKARGFTNGLSDDMARKLSKFTDFCETLQSSIESHLINSQTVLNGVWPGDLSVKTMTAVAYDHLRDNLWTPSGFPARLLPYQAVPFFSFEVRW